MGMLYRRGNIWWVKYYRDGRPYRETSSSSSETVAKRLLRLREGDIERGVPVTPRVNRCRFGELAQDVVNDYVVNGKRSVDHLRRRITKHLSPFFGSRRAAAIITADVRRYTASRQEHGASNGEINRELSILKRAFNLAIQGGKLLHKPYIPMLQEDNVRSGFFEPEQFEAVLKDLPPALQAPMKFAYVTGWRIHSEVLNLHWRQVDFSSATVRLDSGTTKNREGRVFPFTGELRALLETQREYTRGIERDRGAICLWVFHREGIPIRHFYGAWRTACRTAGCPARIPHDLRRTAVRNLVRTGVPERVAMQLTGHKTRSVFERYNIVSEGDLREAARRIDHGHNFGHN